MAPVNPADPVAAYFDRCAAEGRMSTFSPDERWKLHALLARWGVRAGERVLEPGCGSGRLTELLATATGGDGAVVGADISHGMLSSAAERGLPSHVTLLRAEASALPVAGRTFHHVICFNVFPHFENPTHVIAELARTLRPGGRLWINHTLKRNEINQLHAGLDRPVRSHRLPAPDTFRRLLARHGLTVLELGDRPEGFTLQALRP